MPSFLSTSTSGYFYTFIRQMVQKNAPGRTGGEQLVLGKQLIATCIFERCLSIPGQAHPLFKNIYYINPGKTDRQLSDDPMQIRQEHFCKCCVELNYFLFFLVHRRVKNGKKRLKRGYLG